MKKPSFILLMLFLTVNLYAATDFTFDGLIRTRYEYQVNNADAGLSNKDEKSYFRFKFSAGLLAEFNKTFSGYIKISNESRSYIYNGGGSTKYNINEFVVDNIYFNASKLFGTADIKAGRMDLPPGEYGEGFLIADGTPLDGSRTNYFNALKVKYNFLQGSVEFIGIYNTRVDDIIPVINENSPATPLNDSNESALVIYGKTKLSDKVYIEPYYIYKHEDAVTKGKLQNDINTFGSYFKYDLKSVIFRAQGAFQLRNYDNAVHGAFGGYIFADVPAGIFKPSLGYAFLSGDNPNTAGAEGWNPLFSRSTWMSEIVASLYKHESGVCYWTNLQMCKLDLNITPAKDLKVLLSYALLYANEKVANNSSGVFGSGKNRGGLAAAKISYNISKVFSTYVLGEYFVPGDFYYNDAKHATFLRVELSAKI